MTFLNSANIFYIYPNYQRGRNANFVLKYFFIKKIERGGQKQSIMMGLFRPENLKMFRQKKLPKKQIVNQFHKRHFLNIFHQNFQKIENI